MELDLSGKAILVVDDEKFSRHIVAHLLQDMGRPRLSHASDGTEALDILAGGASEVDFIITDFNMPVAHGLQLLKAIRIGEHHISRSMPVAMLTGYSDKNLVDLALALDVNAFLVKPVSKEGLAKRLERMLSQISKEIWVKSKNLYMSVEVDSALDDIVGTPKSSTGEKAKPRRIFIKGKDEPLFRNPEPVPPGKSEADIWALSLEKEAHSLEHVEEEAASPENKAEDTEQIAGQAAARKPLEGYLCALNDIPEGALLARDVHTADGRLFMHSGSTLTPRIISILFDLQELEHPVDNIWVAR